MQSVSSRIWTRFAVSISYDDNHYTTGTSTFGKVMNVHVPPTVNTIFFYNNSFGIKWLREIDMPLKTKKLNEIERKINSQQFLYRLQLYTFIYITDKTKHRFFQAAVVSILLYGCTTWTLTKLMEKKLDGNYTRMLQAILNTC